MKNITIGTVTQVGDMIVQEGPGTLLSIARPTKNDGWQWAVYDRLSMGEVDTKAELEKTLDDAIAKEEKRILGEIFGD